MLDAVWQWPCEAIVVVAGCLAVLLLAGELFFPTGAGVRILPSGLFQFGLWEQAVFTVTASQNRSRFWFGKR